MLLHFISDLLRNPDLQSEFSRDPKATMTKAGLSERQQDALQHGRLSKVIESLQEELSGVEMFAAFWVKGIVEVESISPEQGATSSRVDLTISGNYFAQGALAALQLNTLNLPILTDSVQNPGQRGSILKGVVEIPSNAPLGVYAVAVSNPDGYYGLKENAFLVVGS